MATLLINKLYLAILSLLIGKLHNNLSYSISHSLSLILLFLPNVFILYFHSLLSPFLSFSYISIVLLHQYILCSLFFSILTYYNPDICPLSLFLSLPHKCLTLGVVAVIHYTPGDHQTLVFSIGNQIYCFFFHRNLIF